MTPKSIRTSLDKLVKDIADKAAQKDTPFTETLDAFKALHAYYALLLKNKGDPADDAAGSGFDFASGIAQEDTDGGARLSRRRSS